MDELIRIHFDISSGDFLRGGEASSSIKKALMQLGIKNHIIKKVCIACYETEMNIVIHSLGGYIEVVIFNDRIEITAKDNGPGISNVDLAMTEGYSTASETAREMGFGAGMGLPNIKRSSDVFSLETVPGSYTSLKISINLN